MKEKLGSIASMLTAFLTAGCCLGPLLLIPIGLTGLAGTLSIFATKHQGLLTIITLAILALSFYFVYGCGCRKRSSIILLWLSTLFVSGMLAYTAIVKDWFRFIH